MSDHELRVRRASVLEVDSVRHGFSTRLGGHSMAYRRSPEMPGELNLGFTASDSRENVLANRTLLLGDILDDPQPLVTLRQIHSAIVHRVDRADACEEAALEGDGLMTDEPGIALSIQTADCVPILVADRKRGAVAAFHAGWRGTLQRIVEIGIMQMQREFGSQPENLVAAIGPSIRPCCYRVGGEVKHEFRSRFAYAGELFHSKNDLVQSHGKSPTPADSEEKSDRDETRIYLDLPEANRRQLLDAGLPQSAIQMVGECTGCHVDLFFSYRAELGFTGRMLSVISRPA